MRRVLPILMVFLAGIGVGYFVAPESAPPPTQDALTQEAPAPAQPKRPTEGVRPPAPEEVLPPEPMLQGRPPKRPTEPKPPAPQRVTSDGRVAVVVKVTLPDGSVPADGEIHWSADPDAAIRSMRHMAWKPPQTAAYIQPGEAWIIATSGTAQGLKSYPAHVQVSAEGAQQEVLLELQERAGIYGKVVLPAKFDRPRLRVRLLRYAGDTPPDKPVFNRTAPSVSPRARDGYGFAFHDLKPGGYLLGLSLGAREMVLIQDVRVQDAMVEQDLVIEAFDPKRYMEVIVLGPKGKPLRDAQVSISYSGAGMSVGGGNVALLRDDGAVIVDHIPAHTLREDGTYKDGVYTLHVRTRKYGEIVRVYDPSSTPSLTVRVGELQELTVEFVGDSATAAPPDLRVGLRAVGESGVMNPQGIGPSGSVQFGERPPGSYEVVMLAGRPHSSLVAVHRIEFAPGDTVKRVPLPVFHRLVLRLPKNAVEPAFSLSRKFGKEQWSYGWAQSGETGELVFEYLTEGTYTLSGHVGTRWVKREVHLPAESVVRLD